MIEPGHKYCRTCGRIKPYSEFYKRPYGDGLSIHCRKCITRRQVMRYSKPKNKTKIGNRFKNDVAQECMRCGKIKPNSEFKKKDNCKDCCTKKFNPYYMYKCIYCGGVGINKYEITKYCNHVCRYKHLSKNLTDEYIIGLLNNDIDIIKGLDIPKELIEAKRSHIKVIRILNEVM